MQMRSCYSCGCQLNRGFNPVCRKCVAKYGSVDACPHLHCEHCGVTLTEEEKQKWIDSTRDSSGAAPG
jgi:NMD protein affecting ribosome stability and mRNA decay